MTTINLKTVLSQMRRLHDLQTSDLIKQVFALQELEERLLQQDKPQEKPSEQQDHPQM